MKRRARLPAADGIESGVERLHTSSASRRAHSNTFFAGNRYEINLGRDVNIIQEEITDGEAVLKLEIDDERLEKHIEIASKRVSQQVNIPGFRKGKAPKSILINHLGRDYLVEESLRSLVPEAVDEAIEKQNLEAFAVPRVDIEDADPTVRLRARVPLRPSVEVGDYRTLRFDDAAEPITDANVEEMLAQIQRAYGYTRTVERPSQSGDVVVFSGNANLGENKLFEVEDREFMLDPDNHMGINGFVENLIGLQAGDTKHFKGELRSPDEDEDGDEGDEDGGEEREVDVYVEVSEVKEVVLPDLDDDLAKTYGNEDIETLDALRQHIRGGLEAESERRLVNALELKVVGAIVDSSEFHLSPIIVENEGRRLLGREIQRRQMFMGGRGPKLRPEDIQPESYEAAEEAAEANLKRALVLEEIADLEQIEISDEDVQSELDRINEQAQASDAPTIEDISETRESIRDNLRGRRTLDLAVRIARGLEDND